jgi:hypothetical protein
VDDVLLEYLERIPPTGRLTAAEILTALAFADERGVGLQQWRTVSEHLFGTAPSEAELRVLTRSSYGAFVVETTAPESGGSVYRLFHPAMREVLRTQYGAAPPSV